MSNKRKIVVFGGTFNPPHIGHLAMAKRVMAEVSPDELIFMPANESPHKMGTIGMGANADQRLAMTDILLKSADCKDFSLSRVEIDRKGKSFTIDTIKELKNGLYADCDLYFVMGMDSFLDIKSWKDYKAIFSEVSLVILARNSDNSGLKDINDLNKFINIELSLDFCYDLKDKAYLINELGREVLLIEDFENSCSSTKIRELIKNGEDAQSYLPTELLEFIKKEELYK